MWPSQSNQPAPTPTVFGLAGGIAGSQLGYGYVPLVEVADAAVAQQATSAVAVDELV